MKIEKGQCIKILFRNASAAEGIVESWENDDYVLKSFDGKSFLIVQSPKEDIMAIKVMTVYLEDDQDLKEIPKENLSIVGDAALRKDIGEIITSVALKQPVISESDEQNIRIKKLVDLRIAEAEAERKIISEKLKDHSISETRNVEYGLPQFLKVK